MKTGIFGGTFDPVHNEHVNICLSAKKEFNLDRVIVVPSGNPPHKKKNNLSAEKSERFKMAEMAFKNEQEIFLSNYETESREPSYTYGSLMHFKKLYPDDDFYLIIGGDSLIDFTKWNKYKEILSLCRLIVCKREGYEYNFDNAAQNLEKENNAKILFCNYKGSELSSTAIKVFLVFGIDCNDFLKPEIIEYIKLNKLYSNYAFYIDKLKIMLSQKRYIHTVYTVITALKLASRLGFDSDKAFLAATLHDCTKKLSDEELEKLGFVLKSDVPEPVAHSVSGSFVARTIFKVKDKDILNSIRYHTTGRPKMSMLEKIIYVADCIEDTRDYEGVEELRKAVKEDFEKGFLACMELTIQQLKTKDRERVSQMTLKAYEYYTENNKNN